MRGPIGENDFRRMRRRTGAYADKSGLIAALLDAGPRLMLLRPPHFGKTLTISMLDAYFRGERELFRGLSAYSDSRLDFSSHPVLSLDLAGGFYDSPRQFIEELRRKVRQVSGLDLRPGSMSDPSAIIRAMRRKNPDGRKVVVLIDNFDAPIERGAEYGIILARFFRTLESCASDIEFIFAAGTRHDVRTLVAPALDCYRDISADDEFAILCGITRQEAEELGASEIFHLCGGYRFSGRAPEVACPDLLLRHLAGTADIPPRRYDTPSIGSESLDGLREILTPGNRLPLDIYASQFGPLIDAGVLTIRGYDPTFNVYNLGFPNAIVENEFFSRMLEQSSSDPYAAQLSARQMSADLTSGKPETFLNRIKALLGSMSYQIRTGDTEGWYHGVFYCVARLVGLYARTEISTSAGRIDLAVETSHYVYIFEFKLNSASTRAISQIERLGYADQWAADLRTIYKIGVNFSADTRNIADWQITLIPRKEVRS